MPTPARTSTDAIVAAGRAILDADGLEALTMSRVAAAVGVRAPSLYKRVRGRSELVRLIANDVAIELAHTLDAAATAKDPAAGLRAIAVAFRAWALAHPEAYHLLFDRLPDDARVDPQVNARSADALLRTAAELAGERHALDAARTVVAWANGFLNMELAGAFRLGGDVDEAFDFGVERLTRAIREESPFGP
ncbi:MAG: WHG domain-containing protein [Chloroflexi bacterium]|nr:WHG domain-containing protein [Chloroflexota bacterium]